MLTSGRMNRDEIQNLQKKSYESVKAAYENEAHLFIHVHLRGYDDKGQWNNRNAKFFDRYGAPIDFVNTWKEGYRSIEEALLIHNEMCSNNYTYFPRVGAYCGGAHLYKKYNNTDPWTGQDGFHGKDSYHSTRLMVQSSITTDSLPVSEVMRSRTTCGTMILMFWQPIRLSKDPTLVAIGIKTTYRQDTFILYLWKVTKMVIVEDTTT